MVDTGEKRWSRTPVGYDPAPRRREKPPLRLRGRSHHSASGASPVPPRNRESSSNKPCTGMPNKYAEGARRGVQINKTPRVRPLKYTCEDRRRCPLRPGSTGQSRGLGQTHPLAAGVPSAQLSRPHGRESVT